MFLYLSGAEHHDTNLFAGALAELMSPVENPRYLLRLNLPGDWTKGEYYVSVPAALGNKKMTADLASRLGQAVEHDFEPVYTREPAGRLHLLTARFYLKKSWRGRRCKVKLKHKGPNAQP